MTCNKQVCVYLGKGLAQYGFGDDHPFGPDRMYAFEREFIQQGLDQQVCIKQPVVAKEDKIALFHTAEYLERVKTQSITGEGYLDYGDTPAFVGVFEAAACVVGTTLDAINRIMRGECRRAFVPIAGLHHARRSRAGGFCVFNDCGVAIEVLRADHGIQRVAYIDIDAHHGDGVYYEFNADPELVFADMHEDGRHLYPGTGHAYENGVGEAHETKLNIPMRPFANDQDFFDAWAQVEDYLNTHPAGFYLLQCGADSIAGDPITHLRYSEAAHRHAASRLCAIADRFAQGRLLTLGGGGYNRSNLAKGWTAVVEALVKAGPGDPKDPD